MTRQLDDLPAYRDLPAVPGAPPGSSWGVFGAGDQVGTINLLTPERVLAAARLVRTGRVFSLNLDLEQPDPPLSGRRALRHTIGRDAVSTDDVYDDFFNLDVGVHFRDAPLCGGRFGHAVEGVAFVEKRLPLKVCEFDKIAIDDSEFADAGPGQHLRVRGPEGAAADKQNPRAEQLLLARFANFAK